MPWIQCILETTQENAEYCSECLMNANAAAVTFEDAKNTPLFEPAPNTEPLWDYTRVIGLFDSSVDLNEVKTYLKHHLDPKTLSSLIIEPLEDKDWVTITNRMEAIDFGHGLWIIPSHQTEQTNQKNQTKSTSEEIKQNKNKNKIYVILDAGLAFGTGSHPTTALCLKWLAAHPPRGKKVLDYGCGSGILGIAAKKLGAEKIYAVDHDPQALFSTKMNAEKNAIPEEAIVTLLPQAFSPQHHFDLILANILAEPLLELAPRFAEMLSSGGTLLLSGILIAQIPAITDRYSVWFTHPSVQTEEDWACIAMQKK